jgi:hypothetical protein
MYQKRNGMGSGTGGGPAAGNGWFSGLKQRWNQNRMGGNNWLRSGWNAINGYKGTAVGGKNAPIFSTKNLKGGGAASAAFAGIEALMAYNSYDNKKKEIEADTTKSRYEKDKAIEEAKKERNKSFSQAAGAAIGGTLGSFIPIPVVGTILGGMAGQWLGGALADAVQGEPEVHHNGGVAGDGGTRGARGKSTLLENTAQGKLELHHDDVSVAGDGGTRGARSKNVPLKSNEVSAILEKGEVIVSVDAVNTLYTRMQALQETVRALPVGQNDFKLVNVSQTTHNVGDNRITINDINVRFSGSIRLEGGNGYKDYDINELVENKEFVRRLFSRPEVLNAIRSSMNANIGMKEMRDVAWTVGSSMPSGLYGKMMHG